jgi:signal peptide peptidase SppA
MQPSDEPFFRSVFRALCTSFAILVGLAVGVVFVIITMSLAFGPNYMPEKCHPTILPNAEGTLALLPGTAPVVLRIDFHGIIGLDDLSMEKIDKILLDSRDDFLKGNRVKAILLHMNTPGGVAVDSDAIYRSILTYKKKYNVPVYAYTEGLCASGGMFIVSAADKVYASAASTIGSVGVRIGPLFNFSGAMANWGIGAMTITQGKDKDELNPFRPWGPDEGATIKTVMAGCYEQFVAAVSAARPKLTKEKLVGDYGAKIYIAEEAAKLGYIDMVNNSYASVLADLALAAGIPADQPYQVVELNIPQPLFGSLANAMASHGKVVHTLDTPPLFRSELSGKFLYLYQP